MPASQRALRVCQPAVNPRLRMHPRAKPSIKSTFSFYDLLDACPMSRSPLTAILGGTNVLLCSKGSIKAKRTGRRWAQALQGGPRGVQRRQRALALRLWDGHWPCRARREPAADIKGACRCCALLCLLGRVRGGPGMHEEGVGQACVHACLSHNGHPLELLPHTTRSGTLAMHRQYMQPASLGEAPCLGCGRAARASRCAMATCLLLGCCIHAAAAGPGVQAKLLRCADPDCPCQAPESCCIAMPGNAQLFALLSRGRLHHSMRHCQSNMTQSSFECPVKSVWQGYGILHALVNSSSQTLQTNSWRWW